uniref:G-protein coupled receptors family 1 profile domain-containing protein n=1 Tax=Romanomermis culicivorax TaxID=13658 RepID=A0A915IS87_ROMCU
MENNSTLQSYLNNVEPEVKAIIDETSDNCTHVITAVFAMIMTLGLIGNTKVLRHIIWNRNTNRAGGRRRLPKGVKMNIMTTTFIFNLATADLCLMFILAILITRMFTGRWMLGYLACKVYLTLDGVTKFVSVAFIVLLSMDRYLAVCQPLRAHAFRTKSMALGLALMSWIVVCMLMVPVAIFGRLISSGKSLNDEGNME